MAEPRACDSCGADDEELVPVRRVYLRLDERGQVASTSEVDEVEQWCVPCQSQYPNRRVDAWMAAAFFPYALDLRLAPFWAPFGLRPRHDGVTVDGGRFVATFGPLRVATTTDNVKGAHITRDYRWWTAAGARRSLADDGLTFGTNRRAGVCVHFAEPVRSLVGGRKGHSALTVTVADCDGLVAAITG